MRGFLLLWPRGAPSLDIQCRSKKCLHNNECNSWEVLGLKICDIPKGGDVVESAHVELRFKIIANVPYLIFKKSITLLLHVSNKGFP